MDQQRRRNATSSRPPRRGGAGTSPADSELNASAIGNKELKRRLADAGSRRDSLMSFVVDRLKAVHGSHRQELAAVGQRKAWFRGVSRGAPGYALPQPTRWHEAARAYRRVARALARGHLGRAAPLLEKAMEEERAAQVGRPAFLSPDDRSTESPVAPDALQGVTAQDACPAAPLPQEVRLADEVLRVLTDADPVRQARYVRRAGWWEQGEDPDDEDGGDDDQS